MASAYRVVSNTGTGSATSLTATLGATGVPLGDRVAVAVNTANVAADASPTCADSKGNVYVIDKEHASVGRRPVVFSALVTTPLVTGDTITVSFVSNNRYAMDVIGMNGVGPAQATALSSNTSTTPDSTDLDAARIKADGIELGVCGWQGGSLASDTFTAGTNYGNAQTLESGTAASWRWLATEWWIPSATGVEGATGTLNNSRAWSMIAVFYPAATRQYLSGFSTGISPAIAVDTNWTRSVSGISPSRRSLGHKTGAEAGNLSVGGLFGGTATADVVFQQWVTAPLDADQTIAGTLSLVVLAVELAATENAHLAVSLRVVKPDGTNRGVLVRSMATSTEFTTTTETRILGPLTLSSVAALAGDRLVLELGVHGVTPSNTSNILIAHSARNDLSDYALTSGLAVGSVGWWELSQPVTLVGDQTLVPTADVTDGTWLNESGNNTNLFASVDEGEVPNDADYIQSAVAPVADTVEVQLGAGVAPDVGDVALVIRARTV